MFKIKILLTKSAKNSFFDKAIQEYEKRLTGSILIEWIFAKNKKALEELITKEKNYICLDEKGELLTSMDFSKKLFSLLEKGGSRLVLVIGPDEGLSKTIKEGASKLISLSKLTFTHQMVPLILIEQIYRAYQIEKGTPYQK